MPSVTADKKGCTKIACKALILLACFHLGEKKSLYQADSSTDKQETQNLANRMAPSWPDFLSSTTGSTSGLPVFRCGYAPRQLHFTAAGIPSTAGPLA